MSEDTQINSLQNESDKDDDIKILANIWNQSMKELKLVSIGIDNTGHSKYIVSVYEYMFPKTTIKFHEDDSESRFPIEYELHIMIY